MVFDTLLQIRFLNALIDKVQKFFKKDPFEGIIDQTLDELKIEYLFNWGKISEENNLHLMELLMHNYDVRWIRKATFKKSGDGGTIDISKGRNSISLKLNEKKMRVILTINEKNIDEFIAEKEKDELKIYKTSIYAEVYEEIHHNFKELFVDNKLPEEITFIRTLDYRGVDSETASKVYRKFINKLHENIIILSRKDQDIYRIYSIEMSGENAKELKIIHENLDRLVEHYEKLELREEKINYLLRIESELKKDEVNEGTFFRKEGPYWIDFKEGYVVKRDEVEKIKDDFNTGSRHIMLLGEAASGKSVIARNVGYELADETDVFYIKSKDFYENRDLITESVLKLNNDDLVIIEDAHLYPNHCNFLIKQVIDKNKRIKLLFTSRPTFDRPEIDSSQLKKFTHYMLKAFDSAEPIIKKYAEKNNLSTPNPEEIEEIKNKSKESLWVLAYFLMAWEPGKPIEISKVYEKVYNDLRGLYYKYGINGAQKVILALAPFYLYEIGVKRPFLANKLKIDDGVIQKLIDIGEIRESNGIVSLHHSALADIYIKTAELYPELIDSLLDELKDFNEMFHSEKDYVINMFRYYLGGYKPKNYDDIFTRLGWYKKELINDIFIDETTCNAIHDLINREVDIEKIGRCLRIISEVNEELGKEIIDIFRIKIEKENDIEKIGHCIKYILFLNEKSITEFVDIVKSKIKKENDIEKIESCVESIAYGSERIGKELIYIVKQKLEKEPDTEKIGHFITIISRANENIGNELMLEIELKNLLLKIEKEPDIGKIGDCISSIIHGGGDFITEREIISKTMTGSLVNKINLNNLISKIENEPDIGKIGRCVDAISYADQMIGNKLVGKLDLNNLISKIEKESDIEKIGQCIDAIYSNDLVGEKLIKKLDLNNLISKIEKETDIEKIRHFLSDISWDSEVLHTRVIKAMAKKSGLNSLISKIKKESDIKKIGDFLKDILSEKTKNERELIDIVKSKIEKEPDIDKIRGCIMNILSVSEEMCLGLIDPIKLKIEKEPDINEIRRFIEDIYSKNENVGSTLVKKIDLNKLLSKIENESDIEKMGECINVISSANKAIAKRLVNRLKLNRLISKMENESDIEKIGKCVGAISSASNAFGRKFVELVKSKIEKEQDFEKNRGCIYDILSSSEEVGMEFIDVIKSKIEQEPDIEEIGRFLYNISDKSNKFALKLVDIVISKIEKEPDIEKIKSCLYDCSFINREFAGKFVEKIELNNLILKIEKEPDIEKILYCIDDISNVNKDVAESLVNKLKLNNLILKIEKEPDIEKIGRFVRNSSDLAQRIDLNNLLTKIEKESDIEKIGRCIRYITDASAQTGKIIANKIDLNNLISKIEKEPDIEKMGQCVKGILSANEKEWVNLIDIVKSRIGKESDIGKIRSCIGTIIDANEDVGVDLVDIMNQKSRTEQILESWESLGDV